MSVHGLCGHDEIHEKHEFNDGLGVWYCPGQHSECRNCDDRKCMGCVFREYDHDCQNDCPFCGDYAKYWAGLTPEEKAEECRQMAVYADEYIGGE